MQLERVNNLAAHVAPPSDGRQHQRTHLFVAATLYADSGSTPAHIRNMSPSGVLIEAPVLPEPGSKIELRRGELQVTGRIAWRIDNRAGIKLDATVYVADWMARQGNSGQQRVDAFLATVRAKPATASASASDTLSIEAELSQLRAELSELETVLIGDAIVIATHPEIQTIDISLQRIDRILKRLHDGG